MFRKSIYLRGAMPLALACSLTLAWNAALRADDHHDHAHPEKGPHEGVLVELGKEEFHAEVLHDDKQHVVTVFVLDGSARREFRIDSPEVLVNVRNGGKARQFKLSAAPQKGDRTGMCSRFALQSKELCQLLDDHGSDSRLSLKIRGRGYSGKIPHDHDHHDHKH